ncbi:MAG: glutathione S-transferase family protein [Hyphomicrobiales bacterium]|nr:glutathione S-transferase family protein [Hyphomicrobiales bacterium]
MILIGMMDSPFVRRVAISARLMGLPLDHRQVSVFRHMDEFAKYNPVIKAPTFVTDDGVTLMDSTLILEWLEPLATPERRLTPPSGQDRARCLSAVGFAMALAEKAVQVEYERKRAPERRDAGWLARVETQVNAAAARLDALCADGRSALVAGRIGSADVAAACAWRFVREVTPEVAPAARHPALDAFSAKLEGTEAFRANPFPK